MAPAGAPDAPAAGDPEALGPGSGASSDRPSSTVSAPVSGRSSTCSALASSLGPDRGSQGALEFPPRTAKTSVTA
ncbi:hypothetical protein DBP21_12940 [Streptomyces sp. CS147]|nr:hypothetical protein DBP21_12940 [Streptomyces sp. CS147]